MHLAMQVGDLVFTFVAIGLVTEFWIQVHRKFKKK